MRILIIIFLTIFNISVAQPSAGAQTSQSDQIIAEVQEIGAWSQQYLQIVNDLVVLFDGPEINQALEAFDEDDLETVKVAMDTYGETRRKTLAQMKKAINEMPPAPKLETMSKYSRRKSQNLIKIIITAKTSLDSMYDEAAQASGHMHTMLSRVAKGDDSGIADIAEQQILATIRLIEAENLLINSAIVSLDDTHPNHSFQQIILAQNNYAIAEMRIALLGLRYEAGLQDRLAYNQQMKTELEKIPPMIQVGRKNTKTMLTYLNSNRKHMKTSAQKDFFNLAISATETFYESFTIEEDMYKVTLRSLAEYEKNQSSEETDAAIEPIDEEIFALVYKRLEVVGKRITLIAQ